MINLCAVNGLGLDIFAALFQINPFSIFLDLLYTIFNASFVEYVLVADPVFSKCISHFVCLCLFRFDEMNIQEKPRRALAISATSCLFYRLEHNFMAL